MTSHSYERRRFSFLKTVTSDFTQDIKLESSWFMDLHIEILSSDRVSVTHYYEANWDLVPDPDVVFLLKKDLNFVIPLSYQDSFIYYETYTDNEFKNFNTWKLDILEKFTKLWFRNLKSQWFIS